MKNILSVVRGWVVVGVVLGSGVAWGQEEVKIDLPGNCAYFIKLTFGGTPIVNIHTAEGRCADGLASGEWIFGNTNSVIGGQNPRDPADDVKIYTFQEGRSHGIHIRLNQLGGLIYVTDPATGTRAHFSSSLTVTNFDEISKILDDALKIAVQRNVPTGTSSYYKNILSEWHKDKKSFINKWLRSTSGSQPSNATSNGRDDPKVFGRSARGG